MLAAASDDLIKVTREPLSGGLARGIERSPQRSIRLLRTGLPAEPALDTAVSRALLVRASDGLEPESIRLHRPARVVAFGRQDVVAAGYPIAVAAARAHGFEAVERLGGGRAAVFHEQTISFSWTIPDPAPRDAITARYAELAGIMAAAFHRLGIDARVGAVPGEYCPGDWSVNAGGHSKLMGVGQRVAARAAHVGGVVVIDDAAAIRDVLLPVYAALDIDWDPAATGSLAAANPGVSWDSACAAIVAEFAARYRLEEGALSPDLLEEARRLAPEHRSPG